jgi:heme-degrading monooxygenase HmoA
VVLLVKPGREVDFEVAFAEAKSIIAGMPGFRGSPEYQLWRELLNPHHIFVRAIRPTQKRQRDRWS